MKGVSSLLLALIATSNAHAAPAAPGFDEALRRILDRSTAIAIQRARIEQTIATNLPTRFYLLPSVGVSAEQSRAWLDGTDPYSSRQVALTGSVNLFRFGSDYFRRRSASSEEEAQRALLSNTTLETERAGVAALVGWIRSQREVVILKAIRQSQLELHQILRERFQRGLVAEQEVLKLGVDLDNSASEIANAEIQLFDARSALLALLGDEQVQDQWAWRERLVAARPAAAADADRALLEQRPDWQAAEARLRSADYAKSSSFWRLFPSLDASGSWVLHNQREPEVALPTGSSVTLSLSLPLFDRLTNWGTYRAQAQDAAAADAALEQVRRNARSEWESARFSFETALRTALSREKTVGIAQRLFQDGLKRFRAGRATANELAIDRDRELRSELLAIQGWANAHVEFTRFCHAQGKSVFSCP